MVYARLRDEQYLGFFFTVFKLLNDRQSEFRESSERIMYKLSYNMLAENFQAIPKKFLYYKYEDMQDCKIVTPSRISVFFVKRNAYSWREIFSTREKLEKLLRYNSYGSLGSC